VQFQSIFMKCSIDLWMGTQGAHEGANAIGARRRARAPGFVVSRMALSMCQHPREICFEQRGDMRCLYEAAGYVLGRAPAHSGEGYSRVARWLGGWNARRCVSHTT